MGGASYPVWYSPCLWMILHIVPGPSIRGFLRFNEESASLFFMGATAFKISMVKFKKGLVMCSSYFFNKMDCGEG